LDPKLDNKMIKQTKDSAGVAAPDPQALYHQLTMPFHASEAEVARRHFPPHNPEEFANNLQRMAGAELCINNDDAEEDEPPIGWAPQDEEAANTALDETPALAWPTPEDLVHELSPEEEPPIWANQDAAQDDSPGEEEPEDPVLPLPECLEAIVRFFCRYIAFATESQARVLALWVAHTWVKATLSYTPYLHIYSAEKRCGKSRILECLELLCEDAWIVARPTPAALFRTIEQRRPTLLVDEVDTLFSRGSDEASEALRGIFNTGFYRTGSVPRVAGPHGEVRNFSVFCPKALSGIGSLPDTVADRCIPIRMVRRKPNQEVTRFRRRVAEREADVVRRSLLAWREGDGVLEGLQHATPDCPESFTDRQQDIIEPLLAISDMAGGHWPTQAREDLAQLCAVASDQDQSLGVKLLRDMHRVFGGARMVKTSQVLEVLVGLDTDAPWADRWGEDVLGRSVIVRAANQMAAMLKPYEISPRTMRFGSEGLAKGYRSEDFKDAWERYCPNL